MKTRGLIIALILLSEIISAQISPGKLAKVHDHLEGISNCTQCHSLGNKVTNEKCLACHVEIKERITLNKGYHSSVEVANKECASCHNDHHGREFQIIRFDTTEFNHKLTGYELEGSHLETTCANCHTGKNIGNTELKKKTFTYLGLDPSCLTCHDDYHQQTLASNCTDCHDINKFRPAPKFNHDNTKYILKGKHATVACVDCHKLSERNGKDFQQFADTDFKNCTSCHTDVHNNNFGQNCTKCHSEESFKSIKAINTFDHNKTDYPLEGMHIDVDCKDCHKRNYTDPLAFKRCSDCHVDYHENQFKQENKLSDCKDCHSLNGFQESLYSLERHNKSVFPLEGSHRATPCFACHKKEEKWSFRKIGVNCIDCHTDIHENFISQKYYIDKTCNTCHSEASWVQISFNHSKTNFELQGAHNELSCRKCHFPANEKGEFEQRFYGLNSNCTTCHTDIHYNQFDVNGASTCTNCHEFEDWKASRFDHDKTQFILDGKHKNVACVKCHKEQTVDSRTYIEYKLKKFRCEDCH